MLPRCVMGTEMLGNFVAKEVLFTYFLQLCVPLHKGNESVASLAVDIVKIQSTVVIVLQH